MSLRLMRRRRHRRGLAHPEQLENRVVLSTNSVVFNYTGGPQSWLSPKGVQSVYVTLVGAPGGAVVTQNDSGTTVPTAGGTAAQVTGTLALSPDTIVVAWVGGTGGSLTNTGTPGTGGFNGGASGGTGSWSPGASLPGAGGGGATDLRIGGYLPDTRVMVAGGGGGAGGAHQANSGQQYQTGGVGGTAGTGTPTAGVFPAQAGGDASGDNAGTGGQPNYSSNGNGSLGDSAETGTGNAGGGGGGGGWYGGEGGQAGQSGVFGYAAAAGGGAGGSSYASPSQVTNAAATLPMAGTVPSATLQWVDISTTTLPTMTEGTPVSQQMIGTFAGSFGIMTWQVTSGSLPSGLTLSNDGLLSGTPDRAQLFSFTVSASATTGVSPQALATSTVTFKGDVKSSTVPNAPTAVAAVGGVNSATVSWVAPTFTGSSPLVNYEVRWSADAGGTWSTPVSVSPAQTSYTAALVGGLTYVFQVAASNASTTSLWSASSNAVPVTSVSSPPTGVAGTPGFESVTLSWTAPAQTGGAAVTGYMIRYSSDGGGSWATMPNTGTAETVALVTGLTSQAGYVFEVSAVNSAGMSAWSASSAVIRPVLDPSAPSDVVGVSSYEAVSLSWLAPPNPSVSVTGYVVRYSDDGGATWSTPVATGSTLTTYDFTGLTQPAFLTFQVAAANANGTSGWSAGSAPVAPETRASAPSTLRARPGDRSVVLSWDPPADLGGAALTGYCIDYRVSGSTVWTTYTSSTGTGATRYDVTDLANGTSYDFRVAAVTSTFGLGLFSQTTSASPFTVPGAPINPNAIAGDASATIIWTAPVADDGRSVVGYRIEASGQSGWYEVVANTGSTATSYTATGLVNGTTYLFRVAAINAAGVGSVSVGSNPVVPAGPATAPVQIFGTTGAGSITLTWQPPASAGGMPITSYAVRWSTDGGTTWETADTGGPLTAYTILGLASPATTSVQVAAVTSAGQGGWSASLAQPSSVTGVTSRGLKGGRISLAWRPPVSDGGSPITGYVIYFSKNGRQSTVLTTVAPGQTSIVLAGMKRSIRYRFRVHPVTAAWTGAWSTATRPVSPR